MRRIDCDDLTAAFGVVKRTNQCKHTAVFCLARLHELDRIARRARIVTLIAVQQLKIRAVRIHPIEIDLVVLRTVMIPAAEYHCAVSHHRRVKVVTLIKRDLFNAAAIGIDNVQVEGKLVFVLIQRREAGFALIQQHSLRTYLASRGKYDAPIRQVLRHDVVTDFCGQGRADYLPQGISVEGIFPEIPGDLILVVQIRIERHAHRE